MRQLHPGVYGYSRPLTGFGMDICSVLLVEDSTAIIVDTFSSPLHVLEFLSPRMSATCPLCKETGRLLQDVRDVFVVYTHSDWDHCLGTTALEEFPEIRFRVIAHRLARTFLIEQGAREIARMREKNPDLMVGAQVVLPEITFDSRLSIHIGGNLGTVELLSVPGHTQDSIVCYLPGPGILIAGDAVEDPSPTAGDPEDLPAWIGFLEDWKERVNMVIPSHGRPQGPELMARNAEYLRSLLHT